MKTARWLNIALVAIGVLLATVIHIPASLAFPYQVHVGAHVVRSERPLPSQIAGVLAAADARLATSAIAEPGMGRSIYVTDGGWRWRLLSLTSSRAFAITRPVSEAIVINASNVAADRVFNGQRTAGERSLSGVIAHEMTHGLIRHHFGLFADAYYPVWLREGYCDHIAGSGSLSDAQATSLLHQGRSMPALSYYLGRRRVERLLAANGGSVDRLFASAE